MTLLVKVETRDMTLVLTSPTGNVGGIDIMAGMKPKSFWAHLYSIQRDILLERDEYGRAFWSSVSIKLDGLKMLKLRRPIVNFLLLLVLGVLINLIPDSVYQSTRLTMTLSKIGFEINQRQGNFGCLVPMLVLAPIKADPITKKQSCN